jgi:hypothetical protein
MSSEESLAQAERHVVRARRIVARQRRVIERGSDGKLAGMLSLHFMLWSSPEHKSGWFVEPTYSYSFSNGHQQALGIAVGLLIPIR